MQSILFSAVLDGIAALKRASGGLPNQLLRDVQAIHPNVTFADLPGAQRRFTGSHPVDAATAERHAGNGEPQPDFSATSLSAAFSRGMSSAKLQGRKRMSSCWRNMQW